MYILGIETSCDETSAAIVEEKSGQLFLRSNIVSSSLAMHAKTGGVIPENAAREQIKFIIPVIQKAFSEAFGQTPNNTLDVFENVDAIALTYGPGLIGSLLVGVETAKTIAFVFDKPIIPINHMIGHIYANFLAKRDPASPDINFPAICLVVSGGHTDLLLMKNHGDYKLLGGTRDDAAGEAFDKIGRLLGFTYPAGPAIEKAALSGDPERFRFPRPMIGSSNFDFSFSGLKTAVLREVLKLSNAKNLQPTTYNLQPQTVSDLSLATQDAIIDVLVKKTLKAAEKYSAKSILISGGVAANQKFRDELNVKCQMLNVNFSAPAKNLCTDNAAMIASAAYFNNKPVSWEKITANPELYFT